VRVVQTNPAKYLFYPFVADVGGGYKNIHAGASELGEYLLQYKLTTKEFHIAKIDTNDATEKYRLKLKKNTMPNVPGGRMAIHVDPTTNTESFFLCASQVYPNMGAPLNKVEFYQATFVADSFSASKAHEQTPWAACISVHATSASKATFLTM